MGIFGLFMAGGNQNILNTAIHCASLTCRILVLSDETNCISVFFLPCPHHLILVSSERALAKKNIIEEHEGSIVNS